MLESAVCPFKMYKHGASQKEGFWWDRQYFCLINDNYSQTELTAGVGLRVRMRTNNAPRMGPGMRSSNFDHVHTDERHPQAERSERADLLQPTIPPSYIV